MSSVQISFRVGEVLSATVRRKLPTNRVLISLKGHILVAEPEQEVIPGDEIQVQVLSIFPRLRLRVLTERMPGVNAGHTAFRPSLRT